VLTVSLDCPGTWATRNSAFIRRMISWAALAAMIAVAGARECEPRTPVPAWQAQ